MRKSPDNTEASTGCVKETPQIKIKSAWEMEEKLPRVKRKKGEKKTAWDE